MFENFDPAIAILSTLIKNLGKATSLKERLAVLNEEKEVKEAFRRKKIKALLTHLSVEEEYLLKELAALKQLHVLFSPRVKEASLEKIKRVLNELLKIDRFYEEIGGLIGYHFTILRFLQGQKEQETVETVRFYLPNFLDISEENTKVREAVLWGIIHLPKLSELYPLGGAADRLHLQDQETKVELPAAKLFFAGKTLLEWLIDDLRAKEYLYYKLYGKEVVTPIAMMTSLEKNNYEHIIAICEKHRWFGRPKDSIKIFLQPLVPTINHKGKWCLKEPLEPLLKPSGHGAIWKLAKDFGILDWFQKQKRKKALVRQINNPIAGIDYGLLAFTGLGCQNDQLFGFASCPREHRAAEGINVLIEKKHEEGFSYVLSNIEYCDFAKYNISDSPKEEEGHENFSSNTNLLFADLKAIEKATKKCPFPGVLINLKEVSFRSGKRLKKEKVARLESTMQNIADEFVENYSQPLDENKRSLRKTFITYNKRRKTISTAKKFYFPNGPTLETPERCFYDLLQNGHELLQECKITTPPLPPLEEYLQKGPSFLFSYHPALGPLYSIIRQKIQKGRIYLNSELVLNIAELQMQNVSLNGSLLIQASEITGHFDGKDLLHPSNFGGKCVMKNVHVENLGIDRKKTKFFWKEKIHRSESLSIILHKNAEFHAENVFFKGSHVFEVPPNTQLKIVERGGRIHTESKMISSPTWFWKHEIAEDFQVLLRACR